MNMNMCTERKPLNPYDEEPLLNNSVDYICTDKIVPRKINPQNVVLRLRQRELYGSKNPGGHYHVSRQFYQNIFPNITVVNVEKPPCFLRKFSPDGKHFIAFSADQTSLEVYGYRGGQAAGDLVEGCTSEVIYNSGDDAHKAHYIRTNVFSRFFKLRHVVSVCCAGSGAAEQQLNRECSLFSEDGRRVIVGSAVAVPDDLQPHFYRIHSNNEAVTPTLRSSLEDYSLHVVDLIEGKLTDTRHFGVDKIHLSHNQGIYLYKDTLAVLSVQHQTVHIFQIVDGMMVPVRKIGRFCFEDDEFLLSSVYNNLHSSRAYQETSINSLKHRILVYLYGRAKEITDRTGNKTEIRQFYQHFQMFKNLKMWKMQLLDEDHLLIKYASEEVVTLRVGEPNSQSSFLVVFRMSDAVVLDMFENTSERLLGLLEQHCDEIRNAIRITCSPSNNVYARLAHQRFKQSIERAIYGGKTEAVKRILAQLPISAQSYSCSPYLDQSLYSYDDKWVSVMERPKAYGEWPIRFYGRDSGLLKFRIQAGIPGLGGGFAGQQARRLVAFTFHPNDPFAVSVQRTNSDYVVNLHFRNASALL